MSKPKLTLVGVYTYPYDAAFLENEAQAIHGIEPGDEGWEEALEEMREQLDRLRVIEIRVENADDGLDIGEFTQRAGGDPEDDQVAYDERFLNADGTELADDSGLDQPEDSVFRVAFFLHDVDESRPLETPTGPLKLPRSSKLPDRLREIMEYSAP